MMSRMAAANDTRGRDDSDAALRRLPVSRALTTLHRSPMNVA